MEYDLVVRGGRVLTAEADFQADVAVVGERIAAVGLGLRGRRELDADGLYVLPGAVDGHVHMRTERAEDAYDDTFESGSIAAAFGGVTTIVDQAQVEPGRALADGLAYRLSEAEGQCLVDYGVHVNLREPSLERVAELAELGARGFTSFKFFMTYEGYALPDGVLLAAMQALATFDGLAIVHAENDAIIEELARRPAGLPNSELRPAVMEGEAVHRALAIASLAGCRLLVFHLSAAEAVRELGLAKARGQVCYGEVCSPYLVFDESDVAPAIPSMPPVRSRRHQDVLWAGLADGTVDVVSTDHIARRRAAGGGGTPSVEVSLAMVHELGVRSGRISLHRWVEACCTRPAEVFGLPRKGRILPGYDADLVLFDPERRVEVTAARLHSAIDHTPYEGRVAHGWPVTTIGRGEVLVSEGELMAPPGRGRLVRGAS